MACVVVALASLLWTVPVAARPDGASPTSWEAFAGRVIDWAIGLLGIVAGSETEPLPAAPTDADSPDSMALDGSGETSFGTAEPEGEKTPAVDPDG